MAQNKAKDIAARAAANEDPPSHLAWARLLRTHAEVVGAVERDLRRTGNISLTWYDVLLVLESAPEQRVRLGELAREVVLSRSAVTRSVARLEQAGYLRREECEHDERGAYAVLTRKGETLLRRARPVYWAGIARYFAGALTAAETDTLGNLLGKVLDRMQDGGSRPRRRSPGPRADEGKATAGSEPGSS